MMTFRRCALVALLLLAGASTAFAQSPAIGFKLGVSSSKLSVDGEDPDAIMKFTGGGFLRFGSGRVAIQPELMYITKGAEVEEVGASFKLSMDYVEIPVLLHIALPVGPSLSPYLLAGPAFAFEVGCKVSIESAAIDASADCDDADDDEEEPVDSERRKFDVGAMLGLGISIPVAPGNLLIEARYNLGLINLNDSPDDDTSVKHRSAALLVGFAIPIGRR